MAIANRGAPLLRERPKHERVWCTFVSECEEDSTLSGAVTENERESTTQPAIITRKVKVAPWGRGDCKEGFQGGP